MLMSVVPGTTLNVYVVLAPFVLSVATRPTLVKSESEELLIETVMPLVTVSIRLSEESVVWICHEALVFVVRGFVQPPTLKVRSAAVKSDVKPFVMSSEDDVGLHVSELTWKPAVPEQAAAAAVVSEIVTSLGNVTFTLPPDGILWLGVKDIVYVTPAAFATRLPGVALIGATMLPDVTV